MFEFTDADLVLSKGRSASWDGGGHLPQTLVEVTSVRSYSSPPAAGVTGLAGAPCPPAEVPLNKAQPSPAGPG